MYAHSDTGSHHPASRAVSPVIGVILMVAITVVLAAVIGAFVFGLTPNPDSAPLATVSILGDAGAGNVTLVHDGGDPLELDHHTVLVDGSMTGGNASMTGTLQPGERQIVEGLASGSDVEVTLRHDPSGELIARATVAIT